MLSFLFTSGTLVGFDASGHIAEETKNASVVAARGILSSAIATGILSFITIILFLFCTPPIDLWLTLGAPQPFVQIYALALGKGGAVVMTIIAVLGLVLVGLLVLPSFRMSLLTPSPRIPALRFLQHLALYLPSLAMEFFPALIGLDKSPRRVSPRML
jgi:amino acid transporter